jgi:hypothetical protein
MLEESDPLAIIKVTFEDVPDEFKDKLHILFGAGLTCLILLNIILSGYILESFYKKVRYLSDKDDNYYQQV